MSLLYRYLTYFLWAVAYLFLFAFVLDKYLPDLVSLLILIVGFVLIHILMTPRSEGMDIKTKLAEILVISVLFGGGSLFVYDKLNKSTEEFVRQFDVVAVDVYTDEFGGRIYFYDEDGNYCTADYNYVVFDTGDPRKHFVASGDTVRIDEFKGFFGNKYYRFIKIVEKGPECK